MSYPIACYGCGHSFTAMRVTASLRCARCGSGDIDLDDRQARTAASPGTGWNQPQHDLQQGWNEYQGPLPGANPLAGQNLVGDSRVCQACGGSGVDNRASGGGYNEIPCRNCHGTGVQATHADAPGGLNDATTSGPPVGGARYQAGRRSSDPLGSPDDYIRGSDPDYDNRSGEPRKADTRSPQVKYRTSDKFNTPHVNKPMPLTAPCPECGAKNTQLVRDAADDAWWHCANCGPLANVDKNPEVDPFHPGTSFVPNRKMKTKMARFRKVEKTGKVLNMYRAVVQNNPGLSKSAALTLVRNALIKYPEAE